MLALIPLMASVASPEMCPQQAEELYGIMAPRTQTCSEELGSAALLRMVACGWLCLSRRERMAKARRRCKSQLQKQD